ncbi:hypothetical protein SKAU_G00404840 [Synaphobranchus kaupii]|uniref:Uncharacterized protein n=1 Tax=Synaphobranchus kaupii TaxID=118154 RepID=A0A9Q1IBX4_SYNKA|nr:hypothetical protein SKAU_G00404840 [Synaphobranchus kaupii]
MTPVAQSALETSRGAKTPPVPRKTGNDPHSFGGGNSVLCERGSRRLARLRLGSLTVGWQTQKRRYCSWHRHRRRCRAEPGRAGSREPGPHAVTSPTVRTSSLYRLASRSIRLLL